MISFRNNSSCESERLHFPCSPRDSERALSSTWTGDFRDLGTEELGRQKRKKIREERKNGKKLLGILAGKSIFRKRGKSVASLANLATDLSCLSLSLSLSSARFLHICRPSGCFIPRTPGAPEKRDGGSSSLRCRGVA